MKAVIGIILVLAGIAFGVYVGLWVCFIGGIVQIIDAIKATPVEGLDIAIGIVRILFAGAAGALSAFVAVIPGVALVQAS
jgi:hypothetical protein